MRHSWRYTKIVRTQASQTHTHLHAYFRRFSILYDGNNIYSHYFSPPTSIIPSFFTGWPTHYLCLSRFIHPIFFNLTSWFNSFFFHAVTRIITHRYIYSHTSCFFYREFTSTVSITLTYTLNVLFLLGGLFASS